MSTAESMTVDSTQQWADPGGRLGAGIAGSNLAEGKDVRPLCLLHRGADKSLARATSRCILFDGENISFDASLVIYINSTIIPQIMIINRIYETQNLLSL